MTENKKDNTSALMVLADVPKIGAGLGYDFNLGFTHLSALRLASDVLQGITESEKRSILKSIFIIFEEWKYELGVFPPYGGSLFSFNSHKQQPANKYIKKMHIAAELEKEKFIEPEAWECCPLVSTPVGLFWKLFGDGYEPLIKYIEEKKSSYENILAILILASNKSENNFQNGDCIDAALRLANYKLVVQQMQINQTKPYKEAENKRIANKRAADMRKKQQSEQKILDAHKVLIAKGRQPLLKEIKAITGISEPMISRCLTSKGLGRYKK